MNDTINNNGIYITLIHHCSNCSTDIGLKYLQNLPVDKTDDQTFLEAL